eukprot:4700040-Prymnesium_polylepis.1
MTKFGQVCLARPDLADSLVTCHPVSAPCVCLSTLSSLVTRACRARGTREGVWAACAARVPRVSSARDAMQLPYIVPAVCGETGNRLTAMRWRINAQPESRDVLQLARGPRTGPDDVLHPDQAPPPGKTDTHFTVR